MKMAIKVVGRKIISLFKFFENPMEFLRLRKKKISVEVYESLAKQWLKDLNIQTILDIGSNTGHFALAINEIFPAAKIYSFEPLPECFEELKEKVKSISNATVYNTALGNQSGKLTFKRSKNNLSSSFLEMTDIHKNAFPDTSENEVTEVLIERLNDFSEKISIVQPLLVKIDVQGFEDQVLAGGMQIIGKAKIIIIETSFYTLYENQPLFDDVYLTLKNHNYKYVGALDHLRDPSTDRILQEDSIFIKS